jgi:hypothetical protein
VNVSWLGRCSRRQCGMPRPDNADDSPVCRPDLPSPRVHHTGDEICPRASSARRRQAAGEPEAHAILAFRRTSPYLPAAGEGAFQRLDVAGLALVLGGERSPERSTVRYCDRPCPPAVTASRKVQKECRGFGGKLSHRTTSSDVSPRCRFVGMMNSRPRTIVTLTRGFATKPEWHTPELPGMHITKSPQIRA